MRKAEPPPPVSMQTSQSKALHLEELDAERKRILRDLRSVEVKESDPEGKQRQVLNKRQVVRGKLDAINVAIRAAGGSVKPGG